jgi:uncharacterized membrane protein YfcA
LSAASGLAIFAAGFVASAVNAIAGGGTLVSFPTLIALGRDPLMANATNAVALWPGSFSGALGYRAHLGRATSLRSIIAVPIVGAVFGALLLLRTSSQTFARIVPYLIAAAVALFLLPERVTRPAPGPAQKWQRRAAMPVLFAAGIYGGYFGVGLGIMLLALLGILGVNNLHERNGIKNVIAAGSGGISAILFATHGAVIWSDALVMGSGALAGGFVGAHAAQWMGGRFVRAAIIGVGLVLTVWYLTHPSTR